MECSYCGSTVRIQQDHVRAKIKGGKATIPACSKCNQSKGAKPLSEWLEWIKANNPYRWNRMKNNAKGKRNSIAKKIQKARDK